MKVPMCVDQDMQEKEVTIEDIIDCTKTCPTCDYVGSRKIIIPLQKSPEINYLKCPNCFGASASHMPTDKYLDSYYSSYYEGDKKVTHESEEKVTFPGSLKRLTDHIIKGCEGLEDRTVLEIADFGGGDGSIAIELAQSLMKGNAKQITISVIDLSHFENREVGNIKVNYYKSIEEVKNIHFDLIIASAILEHIPFLKPVLINLFKQLNENGYLYIKVPYVIPLKKILPFVALLYPMHVHDLGSSFWNTLPERIGISNIKIARSEPPLAETEFKTHFILTTISHIMKFPFYVERVIRGTQKHYFYNLIAGWEVIYKNAV